MNMKQAALEYCRLGYSVIPMNVKTPFVKFADKHFTEKEVEQLWTRYPNANIALRTTDFFVIDIDRHEGGHDGYLSIALYDQPDHFVPTMVQKTPNGGEQLFYKKIDGQPTNQNIGWLEGVDVKAHPNNYVLVPPSKTPKGSYEWLILEGGPSEFMPAPTGLIDAVKPITSHEPSAFVSPSYKPKPSRNKTTELFQTVSSGWGDVGSRNDKLAKFVGALLTRGVDHESIKNLAITTNNNSDKPLPIKEVERTIQSIFDKHERGRRPLQDTSLL